MDERAYEARTMVRRLLERFVDNGDEDLREEAYQDFVDNDAFVIDDPGNEWGMADTDYDACSEAAGETEELAIKLVRGMLKEMRNW